MGFIAKKVNYIILIIKLFNYCRYGFSIHVYDTFTLQFTAH